MRQPSRVQRATVPPEPNSASSGWAAMRSAVPALPGSPDCMAYLAGEGMAGLLRAYQTGSGATRPGGAGLERAEPVQRGKHQRREHGPVRKAVPVHERVISSKLELAPLVSNAQSGPRAPLAALQGRHAERSWGGCERRV